MALILFMVFDSNITIMVKSVDKLEKQVVTVDNRVRNIEIKQAKLSVYLNNYNLKIAAN